MSTGANLLQPYCNPLTKCILHSFGGLVLHVRKHVAVCIQGYGDAGVTEHLGDYLRVDIPAEKQRSTRMPQIVETIEPTSTGGNQFILEVKNLAELGNNEEAEKAIPATLKYPSPPACREGPEGLRRGSSRPR